MDDFDWEEAAVCFVLRDGDLSYGEKGQVFLARRTVDVSLGIEGSIYIRKNPEAKRGWIILRGQEILVGGSWFPYRNMIEAVDKRITVNGLHDTKEEALVVWRAFAEKEKNRG